MSETMRWFLGGMMKLARELAIFFAPNINSYKRFASRRWAPVNVVWGRDNRTTGFRVVGRGPGLHVECRFPGGDMNAYLTYAAFIGAGLYGIAQPASSRRPELQRQRLRGDRLRPDAAGALRGDPGARGQLRAAVEIFGAGRRRRTTSTRRASSSTPTTRWSIPGSASDTCERG